MSQVQQKTQVCYFIYNCYTLQIYSFQNVGLHKSVTWCVKSPRIIYNLVIKTFLMQLLF